MLRAYLLAQVPIVELSSQRVLGELMQLIRVGLDHKTNKALIALKPQKAFPKESTSTVFGADRSAYVAAICWTAGACGGDLVLRCGVLGRRRIAAYLIALEQHQARDAQVRLSVPSITIS